MGELCGLDSFEIAKPEALFQSRDNSAGNLRAMQVEPHPSGLNSVRRCAEFINLFNGAKQPVGQTSGLIFKVARTTSLSAIFLPPVAENSSFRSSVWRYLPFVLRKNPATARPPVLYSFRVGVGRDQNSSQFSCTATAVLPRETGARGAGRGVAAGLRGAGL